MRFLALDELLALHAGQVRRFGGAPGVRDRGLLESALAMPRATFDGEPLHPTVFEAAAAYLWLNGKRVECDDDALGDLVIGVASGQVPKSEIAVFLKRHAAALQ